MKVTTKLLRLRKIRGIILCLLCGCSIFTLFASGLVEAKTSAAESKAPPTKLIVGIPTTTFQTLASYLSSLPIALHYWKQENLDVRVVGLPGATVALQALAAKKVDVVPGTHSALFSLLGKFPDAGLKTYFIHTDDFNSMPEVLDTSSLHTIADLEGKTVGVQTLANSQVPLMRALLKQAGGNPSSITFVAVGEGEAAAHALVTHKVDALSLYDGLYGAIEARGIRLRQLKAKFLKGEEIGFDAGLIVRQSEIKTKRQALIGLARGVAKSILFAQTNPKAAVEIHWKIYPATKPRGISKTEAIRIGEAPLLARLKNIDMPDGLYGNTTKVKIEGYMNLMMAGGILKSLIPISKVWDPSMLKEINDFDHQAIIKQAREWKS